MRKELEEQRREFESSKKEFEREKEKEAMQKAFAQLEKERNEFQEQIAALRAVQKIKEDEKDVVASEKVEKLEKEIEEEKKKREAVEKKAKEDIVLLANVVRASLEREVRLGKEATTAATVEPEKTTSASSEAAIRELREQAKDQKRRADELTSSLAKTTEELKKQREAKANLEALTADIQKKLENLNAGEVFTRHQVEHELNLAEALKLTALEEERMKLRERAKEELSKEIEKIEKEGKTDIPELSVLLKKIDERHIERMKKVKEEMQARQAAEAAEKERIRELFKPTTAQQETAVEDFPVASNSPATEEMETEPTVERPVAVEPSQPPVKLDRWVGQHFKALSATIGQVINDKTARKLATEVRRDKSLQSAVKLHKILMKERKPELAKNLVKLSQFFFSAEDFVKLKSETGLPSTPEILGKRRSDAPQRKRLVRRTEAT